MKAFLLVAGLGTRLRPLTNDLPKCLVPINGKPLMAYWFSLFEKYKIDEVLINLHYLPEKVLGFLEEYKTTLKIKTFYERTLLGSAGTILANKGWVENDKDFIIAYGDNLTNANLKALIDFHRKNSSVLTMAVFKTKRPKECGIASIDNDHTIVNFVEKPDYPENDWANAGLFVASPQIFDYFPEQNERELDLGFHVLPNLIGKMKAYYLEDYILDIGNIDRYKQAQLDVQKLKFE